MRVTYSASIDAAYIYVADEIAHGEATTTVCPDGMEAFVMLDFDAAGRLLGIEVQGASHRLPESVIRAAQEI
jgi:uncharacterized protein YuzE